MNLQFKDIIKNGTKGILIRWPERIDKAFLREIWACELFLSQQMKGVKSIIAAMNSLTILFYDDAPTIREIFDKLSDLKQDDLLSYLPTSIQHKIPVCYHPQVATDLHSVCDQLNLSITQLESLHTKNKYYSIQTGFLPGFPYLLGVEETLQISRKAAPSLSVPSGSVAIANQFTGIYPSKSSGGWHVIGRTPIKIFNASNKTAPCLINRNDTVIFYSISLEAFLHWTE